ncbi:hypothetical protein KIPB_000224 [Kipferlia bialata]|uniref:Uncharacterized protein n=1 Tax=Kipferlia bialata TaxID=797122 RepID=A0A9K3CQ63_9EUKA|nr:hypothetical protein KIPB_000224 [Kipferlia bialata]|eukprot:g224.t1
MIDFYYERVSELPLSHIKAYLCFLPVFLVVGAMASVLPAVPDQYAHALSTWLLQPRFLTLVQRQNYSPVGVEFDGESPTTYQYTEDSRLLYDPKTWSSLLFAVAQGDLASLLSAIQNSRELESLHTAAKVCAYQLTMGRVLSHNSRLMPHDPEDVDNHHWLPVHRTVGKSHPSGVYWEPPLPFTPPPRLCRLRWPPVSHPPPGAVARCFQSNDEFTGPNATDCVYATVTMVLSNGDERFGTAFTWNHIVDRRGRDNSPLEVHGCLTLFWHRDHLGLMRRRHSMGLDVPLVLPDAICRDRHCGCGCGVAGRGLGEEVPEGGLPVDSGLPSASLLLSPWYRREETPTYLPLRLFKPPIHVVKQGQVMGFTSVYDQAVANRAVRYALDQFCVDLDYKTSLLGKVVDVPALHMAAVYLCNTMGLVLVLAKQSGILEHIPMGTCAMMRTLILTTSPDRICSLILELQHCSAWLRGMPKRERASVMHVNRLQLEEVIPSLLASPDSVVGSLQSLVLRSVVALSSMAWCRKGDTQRRWQQDSAVRASLERSAFNLSDKWVGAERQLCIVLQRALYQPLLDQLLALADVLNLKYLEVLLQELKN